MKPSKQEKVVISTRVPPKLKAKLQKLATQKKCSLSEYIAAVLTANNRREKEQLQRLKAIKKIEQKLDFLKESS